METNHVGYVDESTTFTTNDTIPPPTLSTTELVLNEERDVTQSYNDVLSKKQRKRIQKEQYLLQKKINQKNIQRQKKIEKALQHGRNIIGIQDRMEQEQCRNNRNGTTISRHRSKKNYVWDTTKQPYINQSCFTICLDCAWGCINDECNHGNDNRNCNIVDCCRKHHEQQQQQQQQQQQHHHTMTKQQPTPTMERMTLKEIKSLANQIRSFYSRNKQHRYPVPFLVTGIGPSGTTALSECLSMDEGYRTNQWSNHGCYCTHQSLEDYVMENLLDVAGKTTNNNNNNIPFPCHRYCNNFKIIYLSSDAEDDLQDIDDNTTINLEESVAQKEVNTNNSTGDDDDDDDVVETMTPIVEQHNNNVPSQHTIYVIGGLVDRNRFPKATYNRAIYLQQYFQEYQHQQQQKHQLYENSCNNNTLDVGPSSETKSTTTTSYAPTNVTVQLAKLPLKKYITHMPSTPVLTCLHVMELLLEYYRAGEDVEADGQISTGDWKDAFQKVLPPRKNAIYIE